MEYPRTASQGWSCMLLSGSAFVEAALFFLPGNPQFEPLLTLTQTLLCDHCLLLSAYWTLPAQVKRSQCCREGKQGDPISVLVPGFRSTETLVNSLYDLCHYLVGKTFRSNKVKLKVPSTKQTLLEFARYELVLCTARIQKHQRKCTWSLWVHL